MPVAGDVRELIQAYLSEAKLMQLATSADNQPWVCNVWFASDDELNIFWFSSLNRRHSDEVLKNPLVAGSMVLPQTPVDSPRGLQFQGMAELIDDDAGIDHARSCYSGRIFTDEQIDAFMGHSERPHRFYCARPTQFVLFDAVNFPQNPRQQLDF